MARKTVCENCGSTNIERTVAISGFGQVECRDCGANRQIYPSAPSGLAKQPEPEAETAVEP